MSASADPASIEITQLPPELAGHTVTKLTGKQIKDAAEDARTLMVESPSVRGLVLNMIIARRIYMLLDRALRVDIETSWELAKPELVMHTLAASAERKALEPTTVTELATLVRDVLTPVIIMYSEMEQTANGSNIPRNGDSDSVGLGENVLPVQGDENKQAGVDGQGNRGEDSPAGS